MADKWAEKAPEILDHLGGAMKALSTETDLCVLALSMTLGISLMVFGTIEVTVGPSIYMKRVGSMSFWAGAGTLLAMISLKSPKAGLAILFGAGISGAIGYSTFHV